MRWAGLALFLALAVSACERSGPVLDRIGTAESVVAQAVWTNRYDNRRTGATATETTLTQASVGGGRFGILFSREVDGTIQAEPLYVPGLVIGGAAHNVVFVATYHNSVYAFDADDPSASAPLWKTNLGPAAPASMAIFHCGETIPEIGISSTPVIDLSTRTMYVVAKTFEADGYHMRLHALDIVTGAEKNANTDIRATVPGTAADGDGGSVTLDLMAHQQRTGLLLEQGVIYLAFGSHCDINPHHGWVQAYDASTLALLGTYINTPDGHGGGIWQSGMGLSSDGNGIFFVAGDGDFDPTGLRRQLGESVGRLKLQSTGLEPVDFWTPSEAAELTARDLDLTSAAIVGPGNLLFIGPKAGRLYVLDRASLGGFDPDGDHILQTLYFPFDPAGTSDIGGHPAGGSAGHLHGSPVYWEGPTGAEIFIFPEKGSLLAYHVDATSVSSPIVPEALGANPIAKPAHPGGMLTVSSNGALPGTGIVWASFVPEGNDARDSLVHGYLYAVSADDVSQVLWHSDHAPEDDLGVFAKFCPPTVANGRLYVGTGIDLTTNLAYLRVYGVR
jgi:hypothetical protein